MQSFVSTASCVWPRTPVLRRDSLRVSMAAVCVLVFAVDALRPAENALSAADTTLAEMAAAPEPNAARRGSSAPPDVVSAAAPEWAFGAYTGLTHTQPAVVSIKKPGVTDFSVEGFGWLGKPFKAPPYYGLRAQRWASTSPIGGMLDFTHAKAIRDPNDTGRLKGTLNGKAVPSTVPMGTYFKRLEFSNGHNILTLNGLLRLAPWWARLRPYVGVGGGITLPHTEVHFAGSKTRTHEYHFAGFAGQALAGIELQLGRTSIFIEYKFTYAPLVVPLTNGPKGTVLVTDLWRQFQSWRKGEQPAGGTLRTTLLTHHAIGGVLVKNRSYMDRVTK